MSLRRLLVVAALHLLPCLREQVSVRPGFVTTAHV